MIPKRSMLLLLGLLAPAATGSGCHRPPRAAVLAVVTDLEGITEPCGCTSRPLGGLDRIAGELDRLRGAGPLAVAAVGDTFVTFAAPEGAMATQEVAKQEVLVELVTRLGPAAVVPGRDDRGPLRPALEAAAHARGLSLWWQPATSRRIDLGGTAVGLVGLGPEGDAAAAAAAAAALRAQGARVVVALAAGPQVAHAEDGIPGVDVVVLTGTGGGPPSRRGPTTFVAGGARGERIGALHLRPGGEPGAPWTFYDTGAEAAAATLAQRERLLAEAGRLAPGAARDARLARAEQLAQALAAPPPPPPAGPSLRWEVRDIDHAVAPAPWATAVLARYNRSLCGPARAESAKRTCQPAPSAQARYVGNAACEPCHAPAFAVWRPTAHARAWATLTGAGKECDLTCVGCHTVGFERPGGFCRLDDAEPRFVNVGCEACHGPGSGHAASPGDRGQWADTFVPRPAADTCRGCHNATHSDQFDFATYLPQVLGPGHGRLAAASDPAAPASLP